MKIQTRIFLNIEDNYNKKSKQLEVKTTLFDIDPTEITYQRGTIKTVVHTSKNRDGLMKL